MHNENRYLRRILLLDIDTYLPITTSLSADKTELTIAVGPSDLLQLPVQCENEENQKTLMQALKPLINLKNRTGNSLNDIDPEITIGDSLVATWDVSDCIVPDSMEVILTAFTTVEGSEYNHFLAPVIRTVPITKDEGEAPYDDTDVIRPPHPPVHPIFNDSIVVLKSYAFTDKSRPDELNFMVITLQECEIRFVARVFSKGPRNELRNEKHTGWSTKNAVSMSKHDINPYGASDTIVQLAAEVRAAPNHPITTVLIGEKNLQL